VKRSIIAALTVFAVLATAYAGTDITLMQSYEWTDNLYTDYTEMKSGMTRSRVELDVWSGDLTLNAGFSYANVIEFPDDSHFNMELHPELIIGGGPKFLFKVSGNMDSVAYKGSEDDNFTDYGIYAGFTADNLEDKILEFSAGFGSYNHRTDDYDRTYFDSALTGTIYTGAASNISVAASYTHVQWGTSSVESEGMPGMGSRSKDVSSDIIRIDLSGEIYAWGFMVVSPHAGMGFTSGNEDYIIPVISPDYTQTDGDTSSVWEAGADIYLLKGPWSLLLTAAYASREYDERLAYADETLLSDEAAYSRNAYFGGELRYYFTDSAALMGGWSRQINESNDFFADGDSQLLSATLMVSF